MTALGLGMQCTLRVCGLCHEKSNWPWWLFHRAASAATCACSLFIRHWEYVRLRRSRFLGSRVKLRCWNSLHNTHTHTHMVLRQH